MDSKMEDEVDGGGVGVAGGHVLTPQKGVSSEVVDRRREGRAGLL